MDRKLKDYVALVLKGMGMGAADVVPGVSGGTIAFIVGIYDELINSIKSISLESVRLLLKGQFAAFWKQINGNFLFSILLGIAISVFSLAKLITWLLTDHPILVWSFFFGLVLASTWFVSRDIKEKSWKTITAFIAGTAIAYYITVATPASTPNDWWFIFLCGSIAICAMIMPGISGSFILVLLGKYFDIMDAIKHFDVKIILIFGVGAFFGITSFSRILSYALSRFRNVTLSVLTGFMLGSLNKVWPWKETLEYYTDSHGIQKPLLDTNILPNAYVPEAIALMVVGFLLVYVLEKISSKA